MSPRTFLLTIFACASFAISAYAETRSFIDQNGRALEGELVSASGDMVTIKRTSDGQVFTVKATNFSKADQTYFASKGGAAPAIPATVGPTTKPAAPVGAGSSNTAPMRIEVKVYPNKNDRATNNYLDDRSVRVGFRVDVRNGEGQRAFTGGKATMMAFAKDLQDGSQSKMISREEFDVSLQPLATMTHDTKEAKLTYDNIGYKYGFKYSGFIMVLKDQAGKTVSVVGSSPTVEKFADAALKLATNELFDKNFKKID